MSLAVLAVLALTVPIAYAQDPAPGWMAYAVGEIPASAKRITRLQMTWKVGEKPRGFSRAFFSPWFGMDPDDNLNLIQPVNPWGGEWSAYTEYFQWSPEKNSNSRQISVGAGQTLTGLLQYKEEDDSYLLTQTCHETGEISSQVVECQSGKTYRVPYVVYEKTFPCRDYPPDEKVVFTNITVECDGTDCTNDVRWASRVKDANCDMTAHIISQKEISITWSTSAVSKYDNMTNAELFALNHHGWAKKLIPPLETSEM